MKKKNIDIQEITYGEYPPELTITFTETIQSIDLNKIVLGDVRMPTIVTGLKTKGIQTS